MTTRPLLRLPSRCTLLGATALALVLAASAGCEAKIHCDVRIAEDKVGDETRTIFIVVNRGTTDIKGATLLVDGVPLEGKEGKAGVYTAPVREVLSGKDTKIGTSLLEGPEKAEFTAAMKPTKASVKVGEKVVCEVAGK